MKTKTFLAACLALMIAACSQKTSVVSVPVSSIDVEQLLDSIDYNMDVTGLSIGDLRVLRNAPLARQGFPFKDSYLRGVYERTTWYDSLMWEFDAQTDFSKVVEKEGETWRDYYYRASRETGMVKYTQEELDFMERLKAREEELKKLNFDVPEELRVNMQNLINPTQLKDFDSLLCQRLAQDGFVIVPAGHEQLFHIYEQNDYNTFPSFVTTDLYLQLYHLYFDCMLRELEETTLLKLMTDFTHDMFNATHQMYMKIGLNEDDQRMARHNAAFFCIANKLFTGEYCGIDEEIELAKPEVERVMAAKDDMTPFFMDHRGVTFPFSLFRARGHYTRSEALKRYFRGMMWLQTAPFGMDNREELKEAIMIALALKNSDAARQKYDKLNNLITFLMGKPDNVSILQVLEEVEKTGKYLDILDDEAALDKIEKAIKEAGNKQIRISPKFEKSSHVKVCIMPQRYQPDAEVLQEMVDNENKPTQRATPKGLDFFAAMGVSPAEQILIEEGQKWKGFKGALDNMKERMGKIDWNETIATQWMNTLKTIYTKDKSAKLPYFMVTPEWDKKDLNAMLASWAELKHDAILYAKQPFGAECGGGGIPEPLTKGYVEPNTAFWKKAIELLENTQKLLKEQDMLTDKIKNATNRIHEEAEFLLRVSEKELAGTALTDEEYDQIKCIGSTFENISLDLIRQPDQFLDGWSNVEGADKKVALVADVYTANSDNNPEKSILFEAVGNADEIFVVVEIDGYLYLTRGAVLSYREFTQPIDMPRLTDEEWQEQLEKNPQKGVPEWMKRIIINLKKKPEVNEEFFYSSGC